MSWRVQNLIALISCSFLHKKKKADRLVTNNHVNFVELDNATRFARFLFYDIIIEYYLT